LAVNVAILTGYLSWLALKWAGLKEWDDAEETKNVMKNNKRKARKMGTGVRVANISIMAVIIALIGWLPIMPSTIATASHAIFAPSNAWVESLEWLKSNSPEPMGDANAYYTLKGSSTYGVMSWWDYGYWITRIAHRIPNANPSQNPENQADAARFLTSQDDAEGLAEKLKSDYVTIDMDTATGKFWAMAKYAGRNPEDYFGIYYVSNGNQMQPVQIYYPNYYQSLAVRLYNFNGKAVVPNNIIVMTSEIRKTPEGIPFNYITQGRQFTDYGEALEFIKQNPGWRIVGNNAFISPVPLESVKNYELAYGSSQKRGIAGVGDISEVKIFKHVK
jgi:dolichyl-diphosphooligosaccharide--protein glycosyltransferase